MFLREKEKEISEDKYTVAADFKEGSRISGALAEDYKKCHDLDT